MDRLQYFYNIIIIIFNSCKVFSPFFDYFFRVKICYSTCAMNNIYLRYILEFAVIIPGAVFSLLPVQKNLRFRPALVYVIAAAIISFFIPAGSAVCMYYGLRSNAFLMPGLLLFFIPYYLTVTLSFSKKLFLFLME